MTQLSFQWENKQSYAAEDFIIAESNFAATQLVQSDFKIALISGEEKSGKTHLVHYWQAKSGGIILDNSLLGKSSSEEIWSNAKKAILENIENIHDEKALFHLLRYAETNNYQLLLTARFSATQLGFSLPDLRSRLIALEAAKINPPDEFLMRVFLLKNFADRQLIVNEEVINYICKRITRSFKEIIKLVDNLEQISSEKKREITIPLVKNFV